MRDADSPRGDIASAAEPICLDPQPYAAETRVPFSGPADPMTINEIIHLSTTSELILMWNYPLEEHCVHVSDGVVLTLHRIPNPRFGSTRYTHVEPCERQGVLVWHGFGLSSNVWVCAPEGPTHNLAFVLADAGFDVWLANARGTMYTKGKKDWDFSMDEMAHLDIPAVVDYILERTKRESLSYIGYSQGTTAVFGALSVSEYLNSKIDLVVAMAPALKPKAPNSKLVSNLLSTVGGPDGLYSVFGRGPFLGFGTRARYYLPPSLFAKLIDGSFKILFNWNVNRVGGILRKSALYSHIFSGASMKNVVHWFQVIQSDHSLQHYDNRANSTFFNLFGVTSQSQFSPRKYPSKHISTKLHLFVGESDNLTDANHLSNHLPSHACFTMIPDYTHLDFLWAFDAPELVWRQVIQVLHASMIENSERRMHEEMKTAALKSVKFAPGTLFSPPMGMRDFGFSSDAHKGEVTRLPPPIVSVDYKRAATRIIEESFDVLEGRYLKLARGTGRIVVDDPDDERADIDAKNCH